MLKATAHVYCRNTLYSMLVCAHLASTWINAHFSSARCCRAAAGVIGRLRKNKAFRARIFRCVRTKMWKRLSHIRWSSTPRGMREVIGRKPGCNSNISCETYDPQSKARHFWRATRLWPIRRDGNSDWDTQTQNVPNGVFGKFYLSIKSRNRTFDRAAVIWARVFHGNFTQMNTFRIRFCTNEI